MTRSQFIRLANMTPRQLQQELSRLDAVTQRKIVMQYNSMYKDVSLFPIMQAYIEKLEIKVMSSVLKANIKKRIKVLIENVLTTTMSSSEEAYMIGEALSISKAAEAMPLIRETLIEGVLKSHNAKSMQSFISGNSRGFKISERVWNLAKGQVEQIEMATQLAIKDGVSSANLAKELQKHLKEPSRLFRRVRNELGELELSDAAKNYSPGTGVYRSSYKNAMRLARNEINQSYRKAEMNGYKNNDNVVGIRIIRSKTKDLFECPICDELSEKEYPKTFEWYGWHIQCRCQIIPITRTLEESLSDSPESVNAVNEMPSEFDSWIAKNKDKIDNAKNPPYWAK